MRDDVRVLLIDFEHLERDVAPAFAFKGGVMRGVGRSLDNQGLSGSVRCFIGLDALEGPPLVKNRPGDAGELVGEHNRSTLWRRRLTGYATPHCLNQASIRAQASLAASAR